MTKEEAKEIADRLCDAFRAWLAAQPQDVRDMPLPAQVDLYATPST